MSVVKKALALGMAFMMLFMTMGMLTVQMGHAMSPYISITGYSGPTSYKKDDKVNVMFTVVHDRVGKDLIKEGDSNVEITLEDCNFSGNNNSDMYVYSHTPAGQVLKSEYRLQIKNIIAKGTGSKLKIRVKNDASTPKYDEVIEVNIDGYNDGSDPGTTPTPPPTPSATNAKYTVTRVRGTKKVSDVDVPNNDRIYFDINNLTSSSDASIRQTYFADITLRVFDEKAPDEITAENIIASGVSSLEMGSFYFQRGRSDPAHNSTIEVSGSVEGYYEVKLTGLRYSGNGNKLSFRVKNSNYIGDITAEITECISKQDAAKEPGKDDSDDDDSKLEVETPYVIVSKYSYGGGNVTAGDTFPLSVTIYNTSETEVVGNMMVTVAVPEGLMLTSSSNTFYVEELDKHASITKSMQVTAKVDAKPQSHTVDVSMKYQYVDDRVNSRRSAETTEKIAIPVVQVDRFQVTGVEIPMEVMMGEEVSVTVNFVNKGRSEAYNLSAQIDGNIQNPGQNQNLGNLASGVTGTADFFILPNEEGMCTGEIKVTYEDTNMQEKTASIRYNTTVKSPEEYMGGNQGMMVGPGGMGEGEVPPEAEKKSPLPIIILGVVIVAIPVLIVVKKKLDAKRKEREDADL